MTARGCGVPRFSAPSRFANPSPLSPRAGADVAAAAPAEERSPQSTTSQNGPSVPWQEADVTGLLARSGEDGLRDEK